MSKVTLTFAAKEDLKEIKEYKAERKQGECI